MHCIPAHIGIEGNERADEGHVCAKSGERSVCLDHLSFLSDDGEQEILSPGSPAAKIKALPPVGGRLMVRLQTLDLRIGVRVPASQPKLLASKTPQ